MYLGKSWRGWANRLAQGSFGQIDVLLWMNKGYVRMHKRMQGDVQDKMWAMASPSIDHCKNIQIVCCQCCFLCFIIETGVELDCIGTGNKAHLQIFCNA